MKHTQIQTCPIGSYPATARGATTSGYYFKMRAGSLNPAARAANFQQQQQEQSKNFSWPTSALQLSNKLRVAKFCFEKTSAIMALQSSP